MGNDDPVAIRITRCHEGDHAADGQVGVPATPEALLKVSLVGMARHGPDEELVADPARGVLGPRPASDQVDLEPVRCEQ